MWLLAQDILQPRILTCCGDVVSEMLRRTVKILVFPGIPQRLWHGVELQSVGRERRVDL